MKNRNRKQLGKPLTEQEMKSIKGGYVFPISEFNGRCPHCNEEIRTTAYTYYIKCEHCGCVYTITQEEN